MQKAYIIDLHVTHKNLQYVNETANFSFCFVVFILIWFLVGNP